MKPNLREIPVHTNSKFAELGRDLGCPAVIDLLHDDRRHLFRPDRVGRYIHDLRFDQRGTRNQLLLHTIGD